MNYTYYVDKVAERLTPPLLRTTKHLAWLRVICTGLNDHWGAFKRYMDGDNSPVYASATSYAYPQTIVFTDNSVYRSLNAAATLGSTSNPGNDPDNWVKIQDNFIGANERLLYNSQYIVFQDALNRVFKITAAPFIYTTHASPTFTINVPLAVYNTLGANNADRTAAIKAAAKKLQIVGTDINVVTF